MVGFCEGENSFVFVVPFLSVFSPIAHLSSLCITFCLWVHIILVVFGWLLRYEVINQDGVCADRFWLDREHCCWSANDSVYKDADCSAWTSWPEMLQYYDKNFFYYTLEVFFYCGWSVLMAALTVTLVKVRHLICFLCCLSVAFFSGDFRKCLVEVQCIYTEVKLLKGGDRV